MSMEPIGPNNFPTPPPGVIGCALILGVIFGPLLTIWALNVLFPILAIPFTLKTWFATILFCGMFKGIIAVPTMPMVPPKQE